MESIINLFCRPAPSPRFWLFKFMQVIYASKFCDRTTQWNTDLVICKMIYLESHYFQGMWTDYQPNRQELREPRGQSLQDTWFFSIEKLSLPVPDMNRPKQKWALKHVLSKKTKNNQCWIRIFTMCVRLADAPTPRQAVNNALIWLCSCACAFIIMQISICNISYSLVNVCQ